MYVLFLQDYNGATKPYKKGDIVQTDRFMRGTFRAIPEKLRSKIYKFGSLVQLTKFQQKLIDKAKPKTKQKKVNNGD